VDLLSSYLSISILNSQIFKEKQTKFSAAGCFKFLPSLYPSLHFFEENRV